MFPLPGEVSGQNSIVIDEDSAHLARGQVAHSRHHGIPVCGGTSKTKSVYGQLGCSGDIWSPYKYYKSGLPPLGQLLIS